MKIPSERAAIRLVAKNLADLLDLPTGEVVVHSEVRADSSDAVIDAIVEADGFKFCVEWKSTGSTTSVTSAIEQLLNYAPTKKKKSIPLVVVPFMGEVGKKRCLDADVAWMDLSGNARIFARGLRVLIEGKPNQFKQVGRPSSAFAPKSARIARWLLMHPEDSLTQREIARATDMDEGFTHRIVAKLEEDGLVTRNGAIRAGEPDLLLDAWQEVYDFSKHHILRGHLAARAGDELTRRLHDELAGQGLGCAATGLAAAWLYTRFASFRISSLYVEHEPKPDMLEQLGFREDSRGANVWLVVPADQGVFHGSGVHDGVRCVNPVQVYLDLQGHPERAGEAAEKLREELLNWRNDA